MRYHRVAVSVLPSPAHPCMNCPRNGLKGSGIFKSPKARGGLLGSTPWPTKGQQIGKHLPVLLTPIANLLPLSPDVVLWRGFHVLLHTQQANGAEACGEV